MQASNEGRYDIKLIITHLEIAKCYEKLLWCLESLRETHKVRNSYCYWWLVKPLNMSDVHFSGL